MTETDALVVVGAFSHPHEAHLACSVLHAAGVAARVADDHIVAADWLFSNAVGGVKVLVRAEDHEAARELLDATASVSAEAEDIPTVDGSAEDVCPRCGSRDLVAVKPGRRLAAFSWLVVGIPLFPVWRRTRCEQCGCQFR